jgi:hypothetical protein
VQNLSLDRREAVRYGLKLPVDIVRVGSRPVSGIGETRNISRSGVLFTAETRLEIGESIQLHINLRGADHLPDIILNCWGTVVRSQVSFGSRIIAATIMRYEFGREEQPLESLASFSTSGLA